MTSTGGRSSSGRQGRPQRPAPRLQLPGAPRTCSDRLGRAAAPAHPERSAVLLNCIDGRAQQPLLDWVRREFDVEHVDVVTDPGVDRVLAGGDTAHVQALLDEVCLSRLTHGAVALVIAGHHDCTADPGNAAQHAEQLRAASAAVQQARPELPVRTVHVDGTVVPQPAHPRSSSDVQGAAA